MKNLRKYGEAPFITALIHGGPGAPGEMAPVARELSSFRGILEPLQTASSLEGQVQELKIVLEANAELPVILVGHSWGAMLGFILSARYPDMVKKLILIGSGPYEKKYAADIMKNRLSRLDLEESEELKVLVKTLESPDTGKNDAMMARLGALVSKTDSYKPMPHVDEVLECQSEIYQGVWTEAAEFRGRGGFIEIAEQIRCPVVAIHGDYDPTPPEGIKVPLSRVLKDFRFILLERCGHDPWIETEAKEIFYEILKKELDT